MIKSFALTVILLLSVFSGFTQEGPAPELDSLKKQAAGFLVQREYDKLIPTAIRIVEMEKTAGTGDSYRAALKNLALWRRLRLIDLVKAGQHRTPNFGVDVDAAEGNFREFVRLAESDPDQLRLAAALVDLAEFLDRFGRPFPIVEETYLRALSIYEKASQGDSDDALKIVAALADSYFYQAEYEKYYPLNRRYVAAVEKISGANDKRLVSALRSYSSFLRIIDRKTEADDLEIRLSGLTGREKLVDSPATHTMLRCLSKIDVIFGNPQSIEKKNEGPPLPAHRQVVHKRGGAPDQVVISHDIGVPPSMIPRPVVVSYGHQPTMFETEILVDETGKVIEVAETRDEELTKKMRDRFSKWKFRPIIIEGKAVRMRIKFPVSYFERLKRK